MAEVVELVERVAERDAPSSNRAALVAGLADVRRIAAWCESRKTAFAAALEKVSSFPEKDVADASRSDMRDGHRTMRRAKTAKAMPAFDDALSDGAVNGEHLDVLDRALNDLEPDLQPELTKQQDELAAIAAQSTPSQFAQALRARLRQIKTDAGMTRLQQQRQATRLKTWTSLETGMWCIYGEFDPVSGVQMNGRLESMIATLFADNVPADCPTDPSAKQDFLRAHALMALTAASADAARGSGQSRPDVVIVVDATNPTADGYPRIDWGIPVEIPWQVLVDWTGSSKVDMVIVRNGVVLHAPGNLNLGRSTRLASRAQRQALRGLYATCAVPGCAVRYDHCKPHHVVWWRNGGPTDIDNLLPLCSKHHHAVHDLGWELRLGRNRELTIYVPNGDVMTTGPPSLHAA